MRKFVRFPAEWEPHASTWLAWPHFKDDWPGKFEPIPWVYAEIIRNLARHERVDLIVNDAVSEKRARKVLDRANALSDNVVFHHWPTDRVWTRDSGCTFVFNELSSRAQSRDLALSSAELNAVTWRFNAWAKYPNYKNDQKIGTKHGRRCKREIAGSHYRENPRRPRRRLHRLERTRHPAHHRRMPAQHHPAAQSGNEEKRLRKSVSRVSRHHQRDLARQRHRRR